MFSFVIYTDPILTLLKTKALQIFIERYFLLF